MRIKWSSVKPGDRLEWEETLCPHRGSFKVHRVTVLWRRGKNIRGTDGSDLYWGTRGLGNSTTKLNP